MELLLIPKNANIGNVHLICNGDTVTGCQVTFDVNYGTQGGSYAGDVWPDLSPEAKQAAQVLQDALKAVAVGLVKEAIDKATAFTK